MERLFYCILKTPGNHDFGENSHWFPRHNWKANSGYFRDQHLHLPDHEVLNFRAWICLLSTFQRKSGCIIRPLSRQVGLVTCLTWNQTLDEENMLKIMLNQPCRKIITRAGNPVLTVCTSHVNRDMSNPERRCLCHLQRCLQCVSPPSAMSHLPSHSWGSAALSLSEGATTFRFHVLFLSPSVLGDGTHGLGHSSQVFSARLCPQHLHARILARTKIFTG